MVEVQRINLPTVTVVANAGKPKRERKKPAPKTPVPEPIQIASVAPPPSPEETAIGALTAGGGGNPQTKQEAAGPITSSEKRPNALAAQKALEEKAPGRKGKKFV